LVGGEVNTKYQFTYGTDAVEQLKKYHADKLILSVDGISPRHGLSTYYDKEAPVDVAMIEQSECCIIAADRSKFGHSAFAKISDLSVADYIVTNGQPSPELTESFAQQGVTVLY
jgi:DeoR/GlpR family transcriptional regulator of sugar metabolism